MIVSTVLGRGTKKNGVAMDGFRDNKNALETGDLVEKKREIFERLWQLDKIKRRNCGKSRINDPN